MRRLHGHDSSGAASHWARGSEPHNVIEVSPPLAGSSADSFTPGSLDWFRVWLDVLACRPAQFEGAFGLDTDRPDEAGELAALAR